MYLSCITTALSYWIQQWPFLLFFLFFFLCTLSNKFAQVSFNILNNSAEVKFLSHKTLSIPSNMFSTKQYRIKAKSRTGWNFIKPLFHRNKIPKVWLWKSMPSVGQGVHKSIFEMSKVLLTLPSCREMLMMK